MSKHCHSHNLLSLMQLIVQLAKEIINMLLAIDQIELLA